MAPHRMALRMTEAAPASVDVSYAAPPTVADFLACDAFMRLIVGPVGSGKSSGCNMEFLRRAAEQAPGPDGLRRTRFVAIRNTYPELRDTTRKTFEQWMAPLIEAELGTWHEQSFTFRMRFADVECDVMFRALDSAKDIKKLLSLELTGAYVNEAREIPRSILDNLKARVGRFPSKKEGGPTWSGIWMDTNPMHTGHELYKLFKQDKPTGHVIFEQPSGFSPDAENIENLPPGYYSIICQGQDDEWVDEYVRGKYPKRDKGSVYGDLLSNLREAGCIGEDFAHARDGVFATFDLGMSDATAIWWWRPNGLGVDFLDHYEESGKPLSHFFEQLERRESEFGWEMKRIVIPHDARARTLVTGGSVLDQFLEHPGFKSKVDVLPAMSLEDGISATRYLLEKPCRFHARTAAGVEALAAYKYEFDLDRRVFSRKPVHDWSSHTADAARYVALYAKRGALLTKKPEAPKPVKGVPYNASMTLDELWNETEVSDGH